MDGGTEIGDYLGFKSLIHCLKLLVGYPVGRLLGCVLTAHIMTIDKLFNYANLDVRMQAVRASSIEKLAFSLSLSIYIYIYGKTYFEVFILLLFFIFSPCTFILIYYILILLFSYIFHHSVKAR